MKKRILSMLLLVAMIVTALPLAVLPVLASEKSAPSAPVYSESDYNALYVSDGLLMGTDFFKMNQYWNPEGEGHINYVVPLGPSQNTAYKVGEETYDFTNADVRNANPDLFQTVVKEWRSAYSEFLNSFVWTTGNMKFGVFYAWGNGTDIVTNGNRHTSVVDAADGYMQFRNDYYGSGGMVFDSMPATTASSSQYVASYTDAGVGKTEVTFLFHNIRPRLTATQADGVKLYGFSTKVFGNSTYSEEADKVAAAGAPFTMTQSIRLAEGANDAYSIRIGANTVFSETALYDSTLKGTDSATLDNNNCYIGWGAAQSWLRLYAFRHYDRVLDDNEILQNHLADLLKYFRIDLGYINLLDEEHLANVAKAAEELTFDDAAEKVSGVILAAAKTEAEAQFTGIDVDLFTVLAKYGLDITPFEIYPLYYLKNAYDFLISGYLACESSDDVVAAYERALDADYMAMWSADKSTEDDYKALYVNNGLILSFDVMSLNAYWGEAVNARAEYPESPMYDNDYLHTDGKTYDFTKLYVDENGVEYPYYADRYTLKNASGVDEYHIIRANNGSGINGFTGFSDLSGSYATLADAKAKVDSLEAEDKYDSYTYWITGYTQSAAYKAAGKAYYDKVNAWMKAYQWSIKGSSATIKSGTNASTTSTISNTRRDSMMVYGASLDPVAGQGYLTRSYPFCTDQGFQIGGLTANLNEVSAQIVSRPGSGMKSNFLLHYNVRLQVTGNKITDAGTAFTVKEKVSNPIDLSAIQSMTFTLKGATTPNNGATDCDSYTVTTPSGTLFSATGIYKNKDSETTTNDTHIIGYSNSFGNADIYAVRYYNRALNAAEEKQNYVADILKWYKLDLRGLDLATMADDLYTLFADVTFDSHTRREVQDMLATLTLEDAIVPYEAKYDAYYETDIPAAYIELGRLYGLDLDILTEGLPHAYLSNTYTLLNELVAKQYTAPDAANAAARLAAAYELDCSSYELSDMTADAYNALYVQDGMVMGFDFFNTNEYWSNKVDFLDEADSKAAAAHLNKYLYEDTVTFSITPKRDKADNPSATEQIADITIKDGYLDLGAFEYLSPYQLDKAVNHGINFVTSEQVRTYTQSSVFANLLGMRVATNLDEQIASINNGSATIFKDATAVANSNALGRTLLSDITKIATYTNVVQRDPILEKNPEGDYKKENFDAPYNSNNAQIFYYLNHDVYEIETDENGDVTVNLGKTIYTIAEHGSNISNMKATKDGTLGSLRLISLRDYPVKPVTPKYVKAADGTVTENTDGTIYWTAPERFVKGEAHLYQNGNKVYENENLGFINSSYYMNGDNYIVLWGQSGYSAAHSKIDTGKLYAGRYYAKALTPDEQAQNHFVDIAKFYRLDLAEYQKLGTAAKAVVHAAFANFIVAECDRAELEYTYQKVVQEQLNAVYDGMEAENAEIVAKNPAFFALAATYRLDPAAVLESDRDMSYLIERVSAEALANMNFAEADAYFADLYYDAYYHIPYLREGADKWNAWIGKLISGDVRAETERLMLLPQTEREGILKVENNLDADVIAAYAEEKLSRYGMTLEEYDALYAGLDASLISLDFFKTNEYWNMSGELPTAPSETTNYLYDGKTYDFTKVEDRMVEADEKYAIARVDENDKIIAYFYRNRFGVWGTANANYPTETNVFDDYSKTMPRQTFNAEEIDEMMADAQAKHPTFSFKKVTVPLWIIWRETVAGGANQFYTNTATFTGGSTKAVKVYMSEADALVDVVTLAGANATEADGVYTSADGKYRYYAAVRPIATAQYYDCISNYGTEIVEDYIYAADIGDSRTVGFFQNMTTIGEVTSYQSQTGLDHVYSHISFKNGYMELDSSHSGPYFSISNIPTAKDSTVYFDTLMAGGDKNATNTKAITFQGANLLFTINNAGTTLSKVGDTAIDGMTVAGRNTPFRLEITSTATADKKATFKVMLNNNADATKTVDVATGTQSLIGHSHASAARIYTYRIYNRVLSEAEQLQNHFMDLAKYYRIDLTDYKAATPEQRAAIHALFAEYEIGSISREELVGLYNAADYEVAEAVLSADMMAIVYELGLEVSGLLAADADIRAYAEATVLADFTPGMPMNTYVVQAVIDQAILYKNAFGFEGVQVRLHSDAYSDMPGVRAIFSANKSVLESYAALGRKVAFGVEICDVNGNALSELYFYTNDEGAYVGTNTVLASGKNTDAIIREVGENSLAFAYTVVYDSAAVQNATYYGIEFAYRFFLEVDGVRNVQDAVVSEAFGDAVSATEAYRYFYNDMGITEDSVVNMVIGAVGTGK